ncbi:MAG: DUF421 domain-containing protein [Clostridia bacterium]|nr:DUF421 domain-containing protein [Clostridia bacterium]
MTVIRTAFLYFVVVLSMRIMGKRQVGELQPSEFVVTILISELASIPIQDLNRPITNGILAIFVLVLLELLLSFLTLKSDVFRKIFEGKSATIIKNGVIDQKMMKKLRITIDDLLEGIRQSGNFSVETVDLAIMETNGKLSVQPKIKYEPVSKEDLNINNVDKGLPTLVISDGKIDEEALQKISKIDILKELKSRNLTVEEVFLMTVNEIGEFVVIRKEAQK